MKKYLRVGNPEVVTTEDRFVGELRYADEWVDRLEDGTADYREAAETTQQRLVKRGVETRLLEIQDTRLLESKWVICKEE